MPATEEDFELRGPLQAEVMAALWKLGEATVDDVRSRQGGAKRKSYTTVQTVLNRLFERGLVDRERRGKPYVYRPKYEQSELLARSIRRRLADASAESRRQALLGLVEPLAADDLDDLVRYVRELKKRRRAGGRGGP